MTVAERQPASPTVTGWAAVLFDLDGTLVDSVSAHAAAYEQALGSVGLPLDPAVYRAAHGLPFDVIIGTLLAGRDPGVPLEDLHRRKAAAFAELVRRDGLRLLPAARLMPVLSGRVPIALVTSASEATVGLILEGLGWTETFDVVVHAGAEVEAKPSPAPYLHAARALGVQPTDCLVFEDSELGVAAARAAGMTVIDVGRSGCS